MSKLSDQLHELLELEHRIAARLQLDSPVPRKPNEVLDADLTLGQRVADKVAEVAGSWGFIGVFVVSLVAWMAWNAHLGDRAADPFPFILLNLILSCVAALQAPVIMMSQNRAAARDRRQADLDYQVNVTAEREVAQLEREMHDLRRRQLGALIAIQQEQLALLHQLAERAGSSPPTPPAGPTPRA